ncbi:MAG: hypothetical protein H0X62_08335 [Bacteroidetes bacterium]|nr:hypothetical protein [Bacteroidota bacterium]
MEKRKASYLKIADFIIKLLPAPGFSLILEGGYEPFLFPRENQAADIIVEAFPGFPKSSSVEPEPIYTAILDGQKLWQINNQNGNYQFIIYDQESLGKIQQIALVDQQFKHWKIYMLPIKGDGLQVGLCPLLYPMGPLIMYYLTVKNEAVLVHASGIKDNVGKGRIFSGFSGVGKSTMAKLWNDKGAKIINDDRLIIRKFGEDFYLYNTPMFYADKPKKTKLDAVYLPFHHLENNINKISGTKALSGLMAFCIQHGYKRSHLEQHLNFLNGLCNKIPVYELGFVPDESIIEFIKSNES